MTASVLAAVSLNPIVTARELSTAAGISKASVKRILKAENFHPYKVQHHHELNDDDFLNRMIFAEDFMDRCNTDPHLLENICFTDESTFFLNGHFNHQNIRYYSDSNPHWMLDDRCQNSAKVNVWAGIYNDTIIGPFFFDGNIDGDSYLHMLRTQAIPALRAAAGNNRPYWQQDGAPAHFKKSVREYLDVTFPGRWIGRRGPIPWPARSPDLTPMDFFLWGHVKHQVFLTKCQDIDELKNRITAVCQAIPPHMLQNSRTAFYNRLGYCLVADGRQFEHELVCFLISVLFSCHKVENLTLIEPKLITAVGVSNSINYFNPILILQIIKILRRKNLSQIVITG
jgi:hypothetical protein